MCNLYKTTSSFDALQRLFETEGQPLNLAPKPAIWPRDVAPIVRLDRDGGRELVTASWGLLPFWAKDEKLASKTFNARSETLDEKPTFREAFKRRRCLVPANAYFEWQGEKGRKTVIRVTLPDSEIFAMAGLWERNDKLAERPLETFTICTTEPNAAVAEVYKRMPAVLAPGDWPAWLSPETPAADAKALLRPYPGAMTIERTDLTARDMKEQAQQALF